MKMDGETSRHLNIIISRIVIKFLDFLFYFSGIDFVVISHIGFYTGVFVYTLFAVFSIIPNC